MNVRKNAGTMRMPEVDVPDGWRTMRIDYAAGFRHALLPMFQPRWYNERDLGNSPL